MRLTIYPYNTHLNIQLTTYSEMRLVILDVLENILHCQMIKLINTTHVFFLTILAVENKLF